MTAKPINDILTVYPGERLHRLVAAGRPTLDDLEDISDAMNPVETEQ